MKKKEKHIFRHRIAGIICMLALFSCFTGTVVSAAEITASASQATVTNSRTAGQDVYLYIKGVEDIIGGTKVQVGNSLCENIQVASVKTMGLPIKTTILFDNSKSLSKRWGTQAKSLIAGLIDNHAEGEEFRIATFADGLNVVADFSTDYDSLKATADGIEFLDQASYLTDILYDLLKEYKDSDEANYSRIVIITDGADDKEINYTQAELTELMKNSGVVIHAVGVKASKNNTLLEKLFSYARYTGGTYSLAEEKTEVEGIRAAIDEDYSLLCLKLTPENAVMDGSRKEAKLSLNTSGGEVVLTASLQMPFADVSNISKENTEAKPTPEPEPEPTAAPTPAASAELPSISVSSKPQETAAPEKGKEPGVMPMILIAAGVVVLVIVILLVVLLISKGKKKKPVDVVISGNEQRESGGADQRQESSSVPQNTSGRGGNTARLSAVNAGNSGKTLKLQSGQGQTAAKQTFIILTDIDHPQRTFRAAIESRLVIGRESGDIVLGHDAAVSYTHCEIIKRGNLFYVNDLKSSNGTFYGNIRVSQETAIMNGGILTLGTGKYKITIES